MKIRDKLQDCERRDDDMIAHKNVYIRLWKTVFSYFHKNGRAKHKTTSCAPYRREKIVSSTIITFCPVNLDKTNLRKQTSVHMLLGQATLIVYEKGSTKIDFKFDFKFARYLLKP